MWRIIISSLLLLTAIFSCNNDKVLLASYEENPCNKLSETKELTHSLVRRLVIRNDTLLGIYGKIAVLEKEGEEFLYAINFSLNRIEKFNLGKDEYLKTIYIDQHPSLKHLPVNEAYFVSSDSIFLFAAGGRIVLLNEQADVKKTWDFSRIIESSDLLSGVDPLNNSESLFLYENSLFIRSYPPNNWDTELDYYKKPFMVEFDLASNKIKRIFGRFPSYMVAESKKHFVNDFKFGWALGPEDELVISFRRGHCLSKLDLETEEQVYLPASSDHLNRFSLIPREYNPQLSRNMLISEGIYHNIMYDPYKKMYYRVATQKQPLRNEATNRLNSAAKKSFSIVVLDEQLNYLGEATFDNSQTYSYLNMTVSKEGIIIPVYDNDENVVTFDIVKIHLQ